jgi:multimeric flavodoxin WrbA
MAALRTIVCASPRAAGKSAQITAGVRSALLAAYPADAVEVVNVRDLRITACDGCDVCESTGRCRFDDDMQTVMDTLARTDELFVVSPIYFAGPPASYKAMLDRLQPHYWLNTRMQPKRPAHLVVVGDGGDPHGHQPLVICTRSALATAGFALESVDACIDAAPQSAIDAIAARLGAEEDAR